MRVFFFLLLSSFANPGWGQEDSSFHLIRRIPGSFTWFAADNLGNLYAVTTGNQLKKYNPKGDSLGVFNDLRSYGKLHSIDASNPLKTILYYRDFKTVIMLDRLMNTVNTLDLRKQRLFQIRAVAQSFDNNLWIFDEQDSKLKKIGEDGKLMNESPDLRLVLDAIPSPDHIFDQNGFVYLYDPRKGWFIFDYYGAFKNSVPLTGWEQVQVHGNQLFGVRGGQLETYTTGTLNLQEKALPGFMLNASEIFFSHQGLYLLRDSGIELYRF